MPTATKRKPVKRPAPARKKVAPPEKPIDFNNEASAHLAKAVESGKYLMFVAYVDEKNFIQHHVVMKDFAKGDRPEAQRLLDLELKKV